MKKLITMTTVVATLLATSAYAIDIDVEVSENPPTLVHTIEDYRPSGSSSADLTPFFIIGGIAAFLIYNDSRKNTSTEMFAPRELVDPDICLDKDGNITGC